MACAPIEERLSITALHRAETEGIVSRVSIRPAGVRPLHRAVLLYHRAIKAGDRLRLTTRPVLRIEAITVPERPAGAVHRPTTTDRHRPIAAVRVSRTVLRRVAVLPVAIRLLHRLHRREEAVERPLAEVVAEVDVDKQNVNFQVRN